MTSRLKVPRGCFQTKRHLLTQMNLIWEGEEKSSWEMSWWFLLIHSCLLSLVSPLFSELDIRVRRGRFYPPLSLSPYFKMEEFRGQLISCPSSIPDCLHFWSAVHQTRNYNFSMVLSSLMSFYIMSSVSVWVLAILSCLFIWTILSCPSRLPQCPFLHESFLTRLSRLSSFSCFCSSPYDFEG